MTDDELKAIEAKASDLRSGSDLRFTAPGLLDDVSALIAEVRRLQKELDQRIGLISGCFGPRKP